MLGNGKTSFKEREKNCHSIRLEIKMIQWDRFLHYLCVKCAIKDLKKTYNFNSSLCGASS